MAVANTRRKHRLLSPPKRYGTYCNSQFNMIQAETVGLPSSPM
jgi:hypothetical protein